MTKKTIEELVKSINENSVSEYSVRREEIAACGYKGYYFSQEIPNCVKDPYKAVVELISSTEIVYEARIFDLESCKVLTYYRDYDTGNGNRVSFEYEEFGRCANTFVNELGTSNVYVMLSTLDIVQEDFVKISKLALFQEVMDYIQNLYPVTKPKPKTSEPLSEKELVELINYEKEIFKISEVINDDGFHECFELETRIKGNSKEALKEIIDCSSVALGALLNEEGSYNTIGNGSDLPTPYPLKPKLKVDNTHVILWCSLDIEDLKNIREMADTEQVLEYLKNPPARYTQENLLENCVEDEEILPF